MLTRHYDQPRTTYQRQWGQATSWLVLLLFVLPFLATIVLAFTS